MAASYKKLWKLLIDKDMKKKDLSEQAEVSKYSNGRGNPPFCVNLKFSSKMII